MMEYVRVGKIVNTHGIRGEVKIMASTDFASERFKKGSTLYIFDSKNELVETVTVKSHRVHKNMDLVLFEGLENINLVERFKTMVVKFAKDQKEDVLAEDEFYYEDIIGCEAFTTAGESIGVVADILETGANDVWVIKRKGQNNVLVPYVDQFVESIDVANKKVVIIPVPGLLG
ncbi:MAG: ribosome maturation factor RimM [Culicoidibacterales bacterium]